MKVDWNQFIDRLTTFPSEVHKFQSPCTMEGLRAVEKQLGEIPEDLSEMLRRFNGAELFIDATPLVTIFGVSTEPLLPALEWAPDWYIDKFTPKWRSSGTNRDSEWAIAMTNYGGLILIDEIGTVKEWETSHGEWASGFSTFSDWIEKIFYEGIRYLEE